MTNEKVILQCTKCDCPYVGYTEDELVERNNLIHKYHFTKDIVCEQCGYFLYYINWLWKNEINEYINLMNDLGYSKNVKIVQEHFNHFYFSGFYNTSLKHIVIVFDNVAKFWNKKYDTWQWNPMDAINQVVLHELIHVLSKWGNEDHKWVHNACWSLVKDRLEVYNGERINGGDK